jgi:lipid A 3-O-deacylase
VRGILLAAALSSFASTSAAQSPRAIRVGADNDAFNFWMPPWDRTDREYTSGVRGTLEYDGGLKFPGLARLRRGVCGASSDGCASRSFSIGQAIYTGDTQFPSSSHRSNAAWLFIEAAERDSSARMVQDVQLAVGVVGPPALGEPMQKLFHSLGPEYQRPVDWRRQLPFEPGFVARLSRTAVNAAFSSSTWSGALTSHIGAALGTIVTSVTAGGGVRAGMQIGGEKAGAWWPRLEVGGELRGHLVARDEFLDGTLFRSSERVPRKPLYDEERLSLGLRWAQLAISYRANRTGLQYTGQPAAAEWSAIDLEWRPRR